MHWHAYSCIIQKYRWANSPPKSNLPIYFNRTVYRINSLRRKALTLMSSLSCTIAWRLDRCTAVWPLYGWNNSKGCRVVKEPREAMGASLDSIPWWSQHIAPISFSEKSLVLRQDRPEGKGLSLTHGRTLLDRADFRKWDMDGTQSARNCNVNDWFMFNRTEENVNSFRRLFQGNLMVFNKKIPSLEIKTPVLSISFKGRPCDVLC